MYFWAAYLLGFPFVCTLILVINAREIRYNDRDGKGNDQNSRQGANATYQFAKICAWNHIAIPENE